MHLTVPSRRSRSIVTGGRDPSEQVVNILGMRTSAAACIRLGIRVPVCDRVLPMCWLAPHFAQRQRRGLVLATVPDRRRSTVPNDLVGTRSEFA